MKWNHRIVLRYRLSFDPRWMRFCVAGSCRRTCAIDLHSGVQWGATVSSERLHGGTVAPPCESMDSRCTARERGVCSIRGCMQIPVDTLSEGRLCSVCLQIPASASVPHRGVSAFRRRIHNGRLFMVSVCATVILICATFLTDDQFSLARLKIFN